MTTPARPSVFISRRRFIVTGGLALAAAWAGTVVRTTLLALPAAAEAKPVEVPLFDLAVGGTKQITYAGSPVLLVRLEDGVVAYSLLCTHLGCIVQWQADKRQFRCPCHDGWFDEFGDVISGPPPLPLERLAVKVTGDRVVVG